MLSLRDFMTKKQRIAYDLFGEAATYDDSRAMSHMHIFSYEAEHPRAVLRYCAYIIESALEYEEDEEDRSRAIECYQHDNYMINGFDDLVQELEEDPVVLHSELGELSNNADLQEWDDYEIEQATKEFARENAHAGVEHCLTLLQENKALPIHDVCSSVIMRPRDVMHIAQQAVLSAYGCSAKSSAAVCHSWYDHCVYTGGAVELMYSTYRSSICKERP